MHARDLHIHISCESVQLPPSEFFMGQCCVRIKPAAYVDNGHTPHSCAHAGSKTWLPRLPCQAGC